MKQSIVRHAGFVVAALVVVLFFPLLINARQEPPIPHRLDGLGDCLVCHKTGAAGAPEFPDDHADLTNSTCFMCHQPATDIPPIPHSVGEREDCLACHETGSAGAPRSPSDHTGRTNNVCRGCHRLDLEARLDTEAPTFLSIPHPLEGREDCLACHETGVAGAPLAPPDHTDLTDDVCLSCHHPAATDAPPAEAPSIPSIPHPLDGRDDCLVCHETGAAGATQVPADHAGRASNICQGCHQPPTAAAPPAEAPAIPSIPHPLEGRDACLACHESGVAGATQNPGDHAGRTDDLCRGCHQPAGEPESPAAAPTIPSIPHPLEGNDDCLLCHETGVGTATQIPADHTGRTSDVCASCHQPGAAAPPPAEAATIPSVPHAVAGRENCLSCHQEGIGGAPRTPSDHAGRTNDTCQSCHQSDQVAAPSAPAEPVPTPITLFPWPENVNSCFDCHSQMEGKHADVTTQWKRSIHSERNVACVECHGGDPSASSIELAMSSVAGYVGVPDLTDIPALCASCHADVARMRQYDLPTDQWAKYKESYHGFGLTHGDRNVATCSDCHGGHQVLKANDPASSVYPSNVPVLCATCHADQDLMAAYNLPTDQFDLYRQSVHGIALLENQDSRAPTCATCHGTHGAAPPGYEEVSNICGACHAATQDYFLKSPHASAGPGTPKCVTCHGRYDVSKPNETLFVGAAPRHCGACHPPDSEPGQAAQALYDGITAAAEAYEEAEDGVRAARRVGMLVGPLEGRLAQANTDLVTARAAQHTLELATVRERTDAALAVADEVTADAEAAIAESAFRRRAMVVAVAAIGLVIVALYLLKRELDLQLDTG